jgi:hypothetical protein
MFDVDTALRRLVEAEGFDLHLIDDVAEASDRNSLVA